MRTIDLFEWLQKAACGGRLPGSGHPRPIGIDGWNLMNSLTAAA